MSSGGSTLGHKFDRWIDECKMAVFGTVLATSKVDFWLGFLISFVVFGTVMNLLAGGLGVFSTMAALGVAGSAKIIGDAFLAIFGVGKSFGDWALMFIIVLLQSILIGLIVFVWHTRHRQRGSDVAEVVKNANNVQDAGIATGLAILGTGCPTCGTSLLAPVIGSLVGPGSYMLAGAVSWGLTIAAVVLILFSLKRIGKETYAIIVSERFLKRRKEQNVSSDTNGIKK